MFVVKNNAKNAKVQKCFMLFIKKSFNYVVDKNVTSPIGKRIVR
jgi:hypothetical protein